MDPLDGASSPFRADLPRGETQAGHQKLIWMHLNSP